MNSIQRLKLDVKKLGPVNRVLFWGFVISLLLNLFSLYLSLNAISKEEFKSIIFSAIGKSEWVEFTAVEAKAPVMAEYLLFIFKSTNKQIEGLVRVKGSNKVYPFSTTINSGVPIAIKNTWVKEKKQYEGAPVLEYIITKQDDEKDNLNVFMKGWFWRYIVALEGNGIPTKVIKN